MTDGKSHEMGERYCARTPVNCFRFQIKMPLSVISSETIRSVLPSVSTHCELLHISRFQFLMVASVKMAAVFWVCSVVWTESLHDEGSKYL